MATQQRSTPLVPGAAAGAADFAESGGGGVVARGYWEQAWRRFRRDRLAIVSGVFVVLLTFAAFVGAPLAQHWLGHGPNDLIKGGVADFVPVGPWSHVATSTPGQDTLLVLGASDLLGRDEFLRLLYGARVSLEVAILATILGVSMGVALGTIAGYYGGSVDTLVSRLTEIVMAFPLLLFAIALAATIGDRLNSYTMFGIFQHGIVSLTLVIGFFSWFYPARIVRAQVLSLREKEFVEAARMVGNSNLRIMRSHLLPHLVGTIIVYSTLTVAVNILFEAALSYLGVGLPLPDASWGNLLSEAVQFYTLQPWVMLFPGLAILFTTLAFNLLGDGLRDALDPRGSL
jgi:ABC-type dipeptide/oligopeptide/nickel transport system permease subunit